jgi:hypothetical protein
MYIRYNYICMYVCIYEILRSGSEVKAGVKVWEEIRVPTLNYN